jgi:phage-related protein
MKPVHWVGSTRKDLKAFPEAVREEVGFSLYLAQQGGKAVNAVPMVGFKGAKVLEVVIDEQGDTFRAVYTVKFSKAVYVLHAFQKKSKKGIATPKPDIDLINTRLKAAEEHYRLMYPVKTKQERSHGGA